MAQRVICACGLYYRDTATLASIPVSLPPAFDTESSCITPF
jgi:hypothetical protein